MNKEKLGFGIIGCGMISRWHAEAISAADKGFLVGVADKNAENAEAFAKEHGCAVFSDADELLSSDEIDVVCICVPSGLHAMFAVKAAEAGKHFVVEKPMAITKEQLDNIAEACEKNGVKGCVISQLRFSQSVQTVKNAIDSGLLGDIVFVDLKMKYYRTPEYFAASPWKGTFAMDGGGALMNQGIHGIDLIQYLAGPVISVSGVCKTMVHSIEVEDTASLTLEFANGAVGAVTATTSVPPGYPRVIEISGTKGTVSLMEDVITAWDIEGVPAPGPLSESVASASHNDPKAFSAENHKMQILDMIEAVHSNREPYVGIIDGSRAVDVILAAYEAGRSGKKVYIAERHK